MTEQAKNDDLEKGHLLSGSPSEDSPVSLEFQQAVAPPGSGMPESTITAVSSDSQTPSGMSNLVAKSKETLNHLFAGCRPWSEFVDRSSFSRPANLGEVSTRIQKNVSYYRTNYLVFFLFTMALAFLTNPSTLLWTSMLLAGWLYMFIVRQGPLVIAGKEYSDREKLIGMSVVTFIVVFFVTNIGALVLYGAFLSSAMVGLHGAFREPDDLFLDDNMGSNQLFAPSNPNIFSGLQNSAQGGPGIV